MYALQKLEQYLQDRASPVAAQELKRLLDALKSDGEFPLASLYQMDFEAFELALDVLHDWRIDRYYAERVPALERLSGAAGESVSA